MDLHLTEERATAEERAAVDSELGVPETSWEGAERRNGNDAHLAVGGTEVFQSRRHLLLPVLHAIQAQIGW
ncbi:MAG TPA: NADH-quinone oxidoreductase subunit E, partial [Candidatus Angelobacter sp.]|nr:NADH-quinone oxidoreductase subunit E [Candidatus Angelobacter sp.]